MEFAKFLKIFPQSSKSNTSKTLFSKLFVQIYLRVIIIGFALTGLAYTFFPGFVFCLTWFGGNECDPAGNYIVAIASLPGYIFASIVLFVTPAIPNQVLALMTFIVSIFFYYLVGLIFDKYKKSERKINKTRILVIATFLILLVALLLVL